jgi:hypothetical protein
MGKEEDGCNWLGLEKTNPGQMSVTVPGYLLLLMYFSLEHIELESTIIIDMNPGHPGQIQNNVGCNFLYGEKNDRLS